MTAPWAGPREGDLVGHAHGGAPVDGEDGAHRGARAGVQVDGHVARKGLAREADHDLAELEVEHAAAGRNETRSRFVECWSMYSQSACALASGALNQNLINVSGNSSNLPGSTAISNHTRVPGLHGVGLHALEPFALDHGDS